jgi:S1-C subfamily serine protease
VRKIQKYFIIPFLLTPLVAAAGQQQLDISTILMRSTFKIEGEGTLGTIFIMGEPSPDKRDKLYYVLITAAHVLEGIKSDVAILHLRKQDGNKFIRFHYPIQIRKEGIPLWTRHPDVDVAAMRIRLPRDADIRLISTTLLGTDKILEQYAVHPGDQLLVFGFPYGAEANEAGFPILRSGRIASYPLTPTRKTKTFLLDFQVFKGNSGGPVLFYAENRVYGGGTHIGIIRFIIGVVSGERELTEHVRTIRETVERKHNLALAVVAHSGFVADLLKMLPPMQKEIP